MKMIQSRSKKFMSIMTVFFAVLFGIMANGCGGGGGGGTVVEAPDAPTAFDVYPTPETTLSATLVWKAPTTGGEVAYYDIYRSETPGTAYPNQLQATISVTDVNQTDYKFIDNVGLLGRTTYYWVVAARNAGGSAPSDEEEAIMRGPANGGGGDEGYGNNLAAAVIFSDGVGITGLPLDGNWTLDDVTKITTSSGFRPTDLQLGDLMEFPYYDSATQDLATGLYPQQTLSTWQGEWKDESTVEQNVTAAWGDNLVSQPNLTVQSPVRIEMTLTKTLDTNMTTYNMGYISGSGIDELYGTDGTTTLVDTAFVFAANATLTIQKILDANGDPVVGDMYLVQDQPLWTCDGPGCFGAEVTVKGNLTYGFVWLTAQDKFTDEETRGTWRITFTLAGDSNTVIDSAPNSVGNDPTSAYIDIEIK